MESKVNRNDPCPCGSGKKFKKCCGLQEQKKTQRRMTESRGLPFAGQTLGYKNLHDCVFKVIKEGVNPLHLMPGSAPDTTPKVEDKTLEGKPDALLEAPKAFDKEKVENDFGKN